MSPLLLALDQTEAFAVHLQNMNVVREAIEQGGGQPLGAEDLRPFVKRQILGDQRRALFVALGKHFEQ